MKRLVKICLVGGLLFLAFASFSLMAEKKRILVVGDSISAAYGMSIDEGWVALLQGVLNEQGKNYEVINASISGDVSASGNARLGSLLQRYQPSWVMIELGGNDGLRGNSLTALKTNLQSMIDQSKSVNAEVLLLGMQIFPNYGPRYTDQFKQLYFDLAADNNVPLVPFLLEGIVGSEGMIQTDGVHPSNTAQPLLLQNVWRVFEGLLH